MGWISRGRCPLKISTMFSPPFEMIKVGNPRKIKINLYATHDNYIADIALQYYILMIWSHRTAANHDTSNNAWSIHSFTIAEFQFVSNLRLTSRNVRPWVFGSHDCCMLRTDQAIGFRDLLGGWRARRKNVRTQPKNILKQRSGSHTCLWMWNSPWFTTYLFIEALFVSLFVLPGWVTQELLWWFPRCWVHCTPRKCDISWKVTIANSKRESNLVFQPSLINLGGGFTYFLFSPLLREDSPFD